MAQAEHVETVDVDLDRLFDAIVRYEDYPKFVEGCHKVEVERKGPGKARATYTITIMKDLHYTLDHEEDRNAGKVQWTLIESDLLKKNNGSWELKNAGPGKTQVKYSLDIEFKIPVPGLILNRLIKSNLPATVRSFVEWAKKNG